jgi:ABC-type lipoprotein export system ATPase subunit
MIEIDNLDFAYNQEKTLHFGKLKLEQGSHWLILGQSGSGKTTLMHLLAGLLKPKAGSIKISGNDIGAMKEVDLDRFRGKNIGLVFQKAHLIDVLNVVDNLALGQYLAGLKQDKKRINEVLKELNMEHKAKSKPFELSQGEQQRVTIARAVLNKPSVLFADEPTASLDDVNAHKVIDLLEQQALRYKATLVIATHDQRVKGRIANQINLNQQ